MIGMRRGRGQVTDLPLQRGEGMGMRRGKGQVTDLPLQREKEG
jgi:hypothetical protein